MSELDIEAIVTRCVAIVDWCDYDQLEQLMDDAETMIAHIRELEAEVATQRGYAHEWESRCYQSIVATQEAERKRWHDWLWRVSEPYMAEDDHICPEHLRRLFSEEVGA